MTANPYAQQARKSKDQLLLEHAPLVKRIVTRMAAKFPPEVELESIYQAGAMGLLDALEKFDESKGAQFSTYAEFRIRGSVLDELRSMDWIPRSVRSSASKIEQAYIELTGKLNRDPTDREIAKHMGSSLSEYHELLGKARPIPVVSLDELKTDHDQESGSILDVLEDTTAQNPLESLVDHELQSSLADAISKLPEQERLVLSLYYDEELNLKEIGEVLNVTESRVSQIRTKAILKLRAMLKTES